MSWLALEDGNKELAEFGRKRFESNRVAYLATIRKDGSPRVHPVTPFFGQGVLFVGMYSDSPKGHDLRRDGRYALHCSVEDDQGGQGEFLIHGLASFTDKPEMRAIASKTAPYTFKDSHVLFVLGVDSAISTEYTGDETVRWRWKSG